MPTGEVPDRDEVLDLYHANRIPGSVMISIGEEDSHWPEIRSGQRPISEYFVLRCIFEHTFTVKQWWSHAPGSIILQTVFAARTAWRMRQLPSIRLVYLAEEFPGIPMLLMM